MPYLKVIDGAILDPNYTFRKFRQEHPLQSFPTDFFETANNLSEYGVYPLIIDPPPNNPDESTYKVVRRSPELVDGAWHVISDLVERTANEKISYSESNGNWDGFNFGLAAIDGFASWKTGINADLSNDGTYFEILRGGLIDRNIKGMQAAYDLISLPNKPPQSVRIAMNNLAITCGIAVNFLIEGD